MISLYISLFHIQDENRREEVFLCLKSNILNKQIKKIIILNEGIVHELFNSPKIELINITKRPFFSDFHQYLKSNSINVIANNDIRFDNSLKKINYLFLKNGDVLSLTRRESDGQLFREEFGDSQDAWIFLGNPDFLINCKFYMGKLGCDNLLNYFFYNGGYRVLNPSKSIRIYHEHLSDVRTYTEDDRVHGNYLLTKPINILQFYIYRFFIYCISRKRISVIFQST